MPNDDTLWIFPTHPPVCFFLALGLLGRAERRIESPWTAPWRQCAHHQVIPPRSVFSLLPSGVLNPETSSTVSMKPILVLIASLAFAGCVAEIPASEDTADP